MSNLEFINIDSKSPGRIKLARPEDKQVTSSSISLTEFAEDWNCELVDPKYPSLHTAATVDPFTSNIDWPEREKEMFKLMHDKFGIGLAAPQVGSSYNMFVMNHEYLGDIGVYKPIILETEGEVGWEEGCLTFPMLYLPVKRPEKVKVQYYKNDGVTQVETWLDGRDARCFLHEYDHLQGILFLDLVSDLKLERAMKKREKFFKKLETQSKRYA